MSKLITLHNSGTNPPTAFVINSANILRVDVHVPAGDYDHQNATITLTPTGSLSVTETVDAIVTAANA